MAVMLAVKMAVKMAVSLACAQLSPALSQVLSPDEEKNASIDAKDATSSSKVATLADNERNSVIRKQRQELHKELQ